VQEDCAYVPNERPEKLPKCDEMELTTAHRRWSSQTQEEKVTRRNTKRIMTLTAMMIKNMTSKMPKTS